jgi:Trypsin-like peptidase domain
MTILRCYSQYVKHSYCSTPKIATMSPRIIVVLTLCVGLLLFSQSPIQAEGEKDAITPKILKPPITLDPNQKSKRIDPLSVRPLLLIQVKGSEPIGTATGFVVAKNSKKYLITNRHVVTGRDPQTDSLIHSDKKVPDRLIIIYHGETLGTWVRGEEPLFDRSLKERWLEHRDDRGVDVVALPIESAPPKANIYSFDLSLSGADIMPEVAMPISIIGFPLRLTGPGSFPIWKTGHIASDPELDFGGQPLFLIDATTRSGMSGSPVVLRLSGRYRTRTGKIVMSSSGIQTLFLGVYAGRLSQESEIGRVWKPIVIEEILP